MDALLCIKQQKKIQRFRPLDLMVGGLSEKKKGEYREVSAGLWHLHKVTKLGGRMC